MKSKHLIIPLLILATLVIDAAVHVIMNYERYVPRFAIVPLAFGLAQIALLAAWLAWGNRWMPVRLLALMTGILLWANLLSQWNAEPVPQWRGVLTIYAAVLAIIMLAMRWSGITFSETRDTTKKEPATGLQHGKQFSLLSILTLMTSVAIFCAFIRHFDLPIERAWEATVLLGCFTVVSITALLSSSCCKRWYNALLLQAIACLAATFVLKSVGGQANYLLITAMQTAWIALSILILRVAGYATNTRLRFNNDAINAEQRFAVTVHLRPESSGSP